MIVSASSPCPKSPKIVLEEVNQRCKGTKFEDKVIVQVQRFSTSTPKLMEKFGGVGHNADKCINRKLPASVFWD
ncbi:MAG: hypothetical protein IPH28_19790 [Cytophagaceae bacterium]|nr:hypothetical protein [Cytophagaceae bacterium]